MPPGNRPRNCSRIAHRPRSRPRMVAMPSIDRWQDSSFVPLRRRTVLAHREPRAFGTTWRLTSCVLIRWKDGCAMRTFPTMQGVAPDPNRQRRVKAHRRIEPEPVLRATPAHQRYSASPTIAGWPPHPQEQGLSIRPSIPAKRRRSRWRPVVVRIAGLLALSAALFGAVVVFRHSIARRQALSWATLGFSDVVLRPVR
jgi:hypothetical protein